MKFGLLGPLMVRRDGIAVPVQAGKQRAVLAALLLNVGRVVPVDDFTQVLWGPAPPPSARVTLQNYVKRLRQALLGAGPDRIGTRPGGYLISVAAGELDIAQFVALRDRARESASAGSWDRAAAQLRAALALWRGEPLADVPSELLALREVPRLAEMRLQALEARIDAELHLGQQAGVIAELWRLASVHPLREHLHALLMLALYRDGRQGEALAAYRNARRVLIEEIGADPGTELQDLHQRMLAADAALATPAPARLTASTPEPVAPGQPAAVRPLTGSAAELKELTEFLDQVNQETPGTVLILEAQAGHARAAGSVSGSASGSAA